MAKLPDWIGRSGYECRDGKIYFTFRVKRKAWPRIVWKALKGIDIKWYQWPRALYVYLKTTYRLMKGVEGNGTN